MERVDDGRVTESDPAKETPAPARARPVSVASVWTETAA